MEKSSFKIINDHIFMKLLIFMYFVEPEFDIKSFESGPLYFQDSKIPYILKTILNYEENLYNIYDFQGAG